MRKILLILSIIIQFSIFSNQSNAQPFQKTFGGPSAWNNFGRSVLQDTIDGGYTIAGFTNDFGAGVGIYLIHTDINGNTLWSKQYGNDASGQSIRQTFDGGYIISGIILNGSFHYYAIRTNNNGDTLWTKTYNNGTGAGAMSDAPMSAWQTTDGGFAFTGYFDANNCFGLIRTDANGDTLWTKAYGASCPLGCGEHSYSLQQTADGGFIICGYTFSFGAGDYDVYLVKTDNMGNIVWTKTYGTTGVEEAYSVQQTTDGGYIITGKTQPGGILSPADVFLIKTNSTGDTLWTKTYGAGGEIGFSVQQTTDGGYIVAGFTISFGAGGEDVYLVRTDANGDTLWTRAYGGASEDFGMSVKQSASGGFIITGQTSSFGAGGIDVYVISTDADGYSGGCNETGTSTIVGNPSFIIGSGGSILSSGATVNNTAINVNSLTSIDSVLCSPCINLSVISEISTDVTCNGFSDGTITITVSGGTGTIEYSIDGGTTFPDTTGVFTGLSPGIYNIVVRDSMGCIQTGSTITITEPNPVIANIAGNITICAGDSTVLTASGGNNYLWSTGDTTQSITIDTLINSNYSVIAFVGICSDTAVVTVTVNPVPVADAGADKNVCEGSIIQLQASGGTAYQWQPATYLNNPAISNPLCTPQDTMMYVVTVSNGNCSDMDTVWVYTFLLPSVEAGSDVEINIGDNTQLQATGTGLGLVYNWSPTTDLSCTDCDNPVANPTQTTMYYVTVTDNNGCSATDSVKVTIDIKCGEVFIPDIFSPNGDGKNDVLKVFNNCIKEMNWIIYNRWGEKVYESNNVQEGWDGSYKGKPAMSGVYVYYLNAKLINGEEVKTKGNVTLIR
ncbi:MAG: gliding motility-associated C-terminal domain-containing protein [Bacteroidales bacterium]